MTTPFRKSVFFQLAVVTLSAVALLAAWPFQPRPAMAGETTAIAPGTSVVFVAGERSRRSIMMVDPAGGMPAVLADLKGGMDTQPTVGPQGQLAWIRQNGPDWELMEDGRVVSRGPLHLSPAYRPDGTLVAAVSDENSTNIYAFAGSKRSLFVSGGQGGLAVSPAFSPDGSKLAYVSNQSDFAQIYITEPGGGQGVQITSSPVRNTDPAWSPSGEYIAYVTAEKDICLIRPDGRDNRRLTQNQGANRDPAFSPDGRKIVFSSDRDGTSRLYVMNLDGSGQRPLLPGFSPAQNLPVWTSARPRPAALPTPATP